MNSPKFVNIEKCEIDVVECVCGYHIGIDSTFIDQVEHFKTICPACDFIIDTEKIY